MTQRPMKFRAWDSSRKEMRYDIEKYAEELQESAYDIITAGFSDVVVEQFTGLKDKNGKEIYEGDIVSCASNLKCPHEVVWLNEVPSSAILGGGMPGFYLSGLVEGYAFLGQEEVIGNIHENPELVASEKES